VVAGAKVTKPSAYGELAKHVNDMCEKNYQYYFLSRDKIAVNTRSGYLFIPLQNSIDLGMLKYLFEAIEFHHQT
jgi:hypothetical protein